MMKKRLLFCTVFVIIVSSCVSKKFFVDLQNDNNELREELIDVRNSNENLKKDIKNLEMNTQSDFDGDGVDDSLDLCPNTIGLKENNGCPSTEPEEEVEAPELSASVPEYSKEEIEFYIKENEYLKSISSEQLVQIKDSKIVIDSLEKREIYGTDKGYVAIDCPLIMKEGIQTNVTAILGKVVDSINLNNRLLNLSNTENIEVSTDIRGSRVVDLAKRMKIEILKNSNFEEIVLINGSEEKNIDLETGTRWKWHVTPKENVAGKPVSLSFKITAFDNKGDKLLDKFKTIKIEVKVAKSTWQLFKDACEDDIKWPITAFLIPLITFFAGVWKEDRKHKRNKLS